MVWQDLLFSFGAIILSFSLLPSIFSNSKPALKTSAITFLILVSFSIAYFTLNLIFSAVTVLLTSLLWSVLAIQKFRIDRVNGDLRPKVSEKLVKKL